VSQLRKSLDGGGAALVTRPPGYVLRLEPDELDALRFERLLADGRGALAAGRSESAAATLRDALALWRGPALADVAYEPWAQAEIARLEERRRAALEERIEADLAVGRHAELVGELEALVGVEPLRERLRGQLMLALYRSGRQADALAAYREGREALVGELGIEPGRALQELERAILRQDAVLEPPPVAVGEAADSTPPPVPPDEERKVVTVLHVDLSGSVALAEEQDPERAASFLTRVVEAISEDVDEAGGMVESVVGASLTAVFGAPVAQEDHVERALHAALALRRRLAERYGTGLAPRLGVDTGEVLVGRAVAGGATLVGGALLTASRLARAAGPGTILVGERAVAAGHGLFEFGLPLAEGAERTERRLACRPLVRALALTQAGALGVRSVFVGREGELELLRGAYQRAVESGRPRLVTVVGDAGVGKSRLVRELWDALAGETPAPLRRTGRCLAFGRGTTYRPLAEVLREQYGLVEIDGPAEVRRALGDREILALTLGIAVAEDLHPLTARERLHGAWVDLLAELAAERPVSMLVEDLHWAQEPLLDLLERVLDDVRGPLLLVTTARPELLEARPSWGRRREAATTWLEPLSAREAGRMLDGLVGEPLTGDLRSHVLERAEGNPFFLEELLAGLQDSALPDVADVPDSVQAVLSARIDLLPPVEKAALQAASVIGRVFWRGPVRELLGGEAPDFAVLEARDFIRRRSGPSLAGEREFAFKHALTREVAYASVPRARRARLHADFAAWIERFGGGRDEHAPYLAHHYAEAVRPEDADLAWEGEPEERDRLSQDARAWLRRAGDLAAMRYELDEAIALYERALELADSDGVRSELWHAIGQANALKYDGEAFWTAMTNAIRLCTDDSGLGELWSQLALETFQRSGMWTARPALDEVEAWVREALERTEPGSPARARAFVAKAFSDLTNGASAAAEASAIAGELHDPVLCVLAWDAEHAVALDAGDYERALGWARRRLALLDRIPDPDFQADVVHTPIRSLVATGRFAEARELAQRADEITRPLTPHHRVHGVSVPIEVEELLGGWKAIAAEEQRVRETIAANSATPCTRNTRTLLVCALACVHLGGAERARELEETADALELVERHVTDAPRLRLALARNDRARAEALLEALLEDRGWYSRGHGTSLATLTTLVDGLSALADRPLVEERVAPLLGRSAYLEPFALRALGVAREDEDLVRQACARFEQLGLEWHAARTAALLEDA
jgi:DNA-binding SARP family transcriptional activator